MPVGWAAAGAALGTIASGAIGADAAKDAARTQARSADRASEVQREMYMTSRGDQMPFMQSGYGAMSELNRLMRIAPQTALGNPGGTEERTQWDADAGGRLIGDTYLPPDATTVDKGGGWYEVHHGGQRVGTLRPGGPNGKFINDTNWQMPTPASTAAQAQGGSAPGGSSPTVGNDAWRPTPSGGVRPVVPSGGWAGDAAAATPAEASGTGLPAGYLTQTFGPEQFKAGMDPGYQWRAQQGAQGVMNTAAAGSGSLSGPALKALMEYNQGAASQEFGSAFDRFQTQQGNIYQRLTGIAGMGQNAAAGVGSQGVATGANIGANITGAGNAAAAGQVGAANAWGGAIGDLGSLAYLYGRGRMDRPTTPAPGTTG